MNTKVNEGKLISGKDALIALANGKEVECRAYEKKWINVDNKQHPLSLFFDDSFQFRLKPRTILINGIEVPAPFLPDEDELFYHTSPEYEKGYAKSMAHEINETTWQQFGAWRTEEEIKQVVAALRQVFGGSHDN
ncbi:MAG: hypothetical protein GX151_03080 [Gammaproteobacteria bacterium]|jgi:hypothetical protein|nr:hypothetical protein [Gammaproteobacteria bacterium]